MNMLVVGDHPDIDAVLERRRRRGLDAHDEVWEGIYHMTPYAHMRHSLLETTLTVVLHPYVRAAGLRLSGAFNLGDPGDFRVPDLGVHEPGPLSLYTARASIVVEVLSPGDETYAKMGFYAERVRELWVVDPEAKRVEMYSLAPGTNKRVEASEVLPITTADLTAMIEWP